MRPEFAGLHRGEQKTIDRMRLPARLVDSGWLRTLGRDERPVRLILRTRIDPAAKQLPLLIGQCPAGGRRGHDHVGVVRQDAVDDGAGTGIPRNDRGGDRIVANIEPQIRFPMPRVWAVAKETVFRQDRSDVAIEDDRLHRTDPFRVRGPTRAERDEPDEEHRDAADRPALAAQPNR